MSYQHHDDHEANIREAWERYSSVLLGLSGREYEEAERDAWAELQATLRELELWRAEQLAAAPAAAPAA